MAWCNARAGVAVRIGRNWRKPGGTIKMVRDLIKAANVGVFLVALLPCLFLLAVLCYVRVTASISQTRHGIYAFCVCLAIRGAL